MEKENRQNPCWNRNLSLQMTFFCCCWKPMRIGVVELLPHCSLRFLELPDCLIRDIVFVWLRLRDLLQMDIKLAINNHANQKKIFNILEGCLITFPFGSLVDSTRLIGWLQQRKLRVEELEINLIPPKQRLIICTNACTKNIEIY